MPASRSIAVWATVISAIKSLLLIVAFASLILGLSGPVLAQDADSAICNQLENSTITLEGHRVRLHDQFAGGAATKKVTTPGEDPFSYFTFWMSDTAVGDLNGDKVPDCVAAIYYCGSSKNRLKTHVLHLVPFINRKGKFVQGGDVIIDGEADLDIEGKRVEIQKGTVVVRMFAYVPNPNPQAKSGDDDTISKQFTCRFRLVKGKLVLTEPGVASLAKLGTGIKSAPILPLSHDIQPAAISSNESWPEFEPDARIMGKASSAELDKNTLLNASYLSCFYEKPIQISKGQYPPKKFGGKRPEEVTIGAATFTSGYDYQTEVADILLGDLNGDGRKDALVLLETPKGADGVDLEVIPVIVSAGHLVQVGEIYLGHSICFTGMKIENGLISLRLTVHDFNDSVMGPTKKVVWRFRVSKGRLIKMK